MPPQSRAESNTNMGRSCFPFRLTMKLVILSSMGTWLLTASLNRLSKISSSSAITDGDNFMLIDNLGKLLQCFSFSSSILPFAQVYLLILLILNEVLIYNLFGIYKSINIFVHALDFRILSIH